MIAADRQGSAHERESGAQRTSCRCNGRERGLGRAFAIALANAGAAVGLVGRSGADLSEAVAAICAAGGRALALPGDVTDPAVASDALAQLERAFGPVHLLVNAAGLGPPIGPFAESTLDDWWRTIEVNFKGPAVWSRAVLPGMLAVAYADLLKKAEALGEQRAIRELRDVWPPPYSDGQGYAVQRNSILAPTKAFIPIEGGGHFVCS